MSDIRKPSFIFLLRFQGKAKSKKVEIFNSKLWDQGLRQRRHGMKTDRYRIRVGGKWFNQKDGSMWFLSKTEFRDLLWRSIKF